MKKLKMLFMIKGDDIIVTNYTNKLYNFIMKLCLLGIILLPFESLPNIMPSYYRPISLYFFIAPFIFFFLNDLKCMRVGKTMVALLIFFIYTLSISYIRSKYMYRDYSGFIEYLLTCIFSTISFYTLDKYFKEIRKNYKFDNESYIEKYLMILAKGYRIVLVIGIIEMISFAGILPIEIKRFINETISGRSVSRIQLVTSEAAYASRQLIIMLPIYIYAARINNKYKKWLYIDIILFLFTFSLEGILTLLVGVLIYFIINKRQFMKILIRKAHIYFLKAILVSIIIIIVFKVMPSDAYYITRLNKILSLESLNEMLFLDGSIFIRIIYPIIGILIFYKHPLIGIGGGNYRFEFNEYIKHYFQRGLSFQEVYIDVQTLTGDSKSLYSKILSETGIIGFGLLAYIIFRIICKIKYIINEKTKSTLILLVCIVLSVFLQFGGLSYLYLWLLMAFINNLRN